MVSGLTYTSDSEKGIYRKRIGRGFTYLNAEQRPVKSPQVLGRIRSLVIPPAWTDVWICPSPNGHLQATGRDARKRKQYRYHPKWSESRNEDKFSKLQKFGKALERIRHRLKQDLKKDDFSREHILAAVVKTMEFTKLRIGNDIYSKENKSYGLTTVRNHHVKVQGSKVRFYFRGKSGVIRDVTFTDARLAKIIRNCQELPGSELFGYIGEDGKHHDIGSQDVNDYLREISGENITAKDFRTWGGTVKALELLQKLGPLQETTQAARKRREVSVIKDVAKHLGNTVAVCRKYYVSPKVFECDRDGSLYRCRAVHSRHGYQSNELLLLKILGKK